MSPAVRLATIWPLSRSDASARAAIARSCAFSRLIASSSAAVRSVCLHPALAHVAPAVTRRGHEAERGEHEHADQPGDDRRQSDERVGLLGHGIGPIRKRGG